MFSLCVVYIFARMAYPKPRPHEYALKVKRGTSGLGLFAEEKIPKGAFVTEYWGELLTDKQANSRYGKYLFQMDNGKTIDGATRKNVARYINHACKPNCEVNFYGNRIFVEALRSIKPGEEITYDYDTEYFDAYIKPKGCKCATCKNKKPSKNKAPRGN